MPLCAGATARVALHQPSPVQAQDVTVTLCQEGGASTGPVALLTPVTEIAARIPTAGPSPFRTSFDPLGGNGPLWVDLRATVAGRSIGILVDPEILPDIVPAQSVTLRPAAVVRGLNAASPLRASLSDEATLTFAAPAAWQVTQDGRALHLTPPAAAVPGLTLIAPLIAGAPALAVQRAAYPHLGEVTLSCPAALRVLTLDLTLPAGARIAYVGSGDSVGQWLQQIGLEVIRLNTIAPDQDFADFTTVVVGVVAFGNRPDLVAATSRLHDIVAGGGHLVTLYQRPDQGWDPVRTPPRPLTIGTPSLRWRVTDPAAAVTILAPDLPLFRGPNRIGPADFDGWNKERGLYFAATWDAAYQPLLAMADPGEAPLTGGMLSAQIGAGRHSHVSLVLHHQLDHLVPGGFRLLANLVQPATPGHG